MRFSGVCSLLAGVCCALVGTLPASARAENPRPQQSVIANGLPLIHLPPVPADQAATVCLVDTGVDENPDTRSAVVGRHATSNITTFDSGPGKHGTLMAMMMGAPANGWGMVGAWPGVKIFSMSAIGAGTYFVRGIDECRRRAGSENIKVIELAVGVPGVLPTDDPQMMNAIDQARRRGINVVAAAGNDGGPLDAPANYPPVFAVGGVSPSGFFCSYAPGGGSATGSQLDISALGCGVDLAFPATGEAAVGGGTSEASAYVAAVLAALRSYRPDLTPDAAERLLIDNARQSPSSGPIIDVAATFRAAGLSALWEQAAAHVPPQLPAAESALQSPHAANPGAVPTNGPGRQPSPSGAWIGSSTSPKNAREPLRLERPRINLNRVRNRTRVRIFNRPSGVTTVVVIRFRGRTKTVRRSASRISLNLRPKSRLRIFFEKGKARSKATVATAR